MPERTEYAPGTPSWVELITTDVEAAKDFYAKTFGWEYQVGPPETGHYVMATTKGKGAAGLMAQPEPMATAGLPSLWVAYVTVADLEGPLAAAEAAGGTVVRPPFDVMDIGRMAVLQDPAGAAVNLWEPRGNAGAEIVNEHGAFTWTDLLTPDPGAAADFYSAVFGWEVMETTQPGGASARMFSLGGAPVASASTPQMDGIPPHWHVYFAVDDADAAASAISDGGGTVVAGPFDTPPGRMLAAIDPTGAAFSVIALDPTFDPAAG
jgi:predicted enzyme related to lactoylglutathione lyase